ncbi:MAG: WS/DGAT/MGAT family O-acyltransferase [Pseudomonadales bacterium]
MQALNAGDAMFLYSETPEQHQHMVGIIILDPSTAPKRFDMQELIDKSEEMTDAAPAYRQRLFHSPLSLSGPILVDDPDFDYRKHVRHIAVPAPGSDQQLAEIIADIASTQLDRSRPLWETWYVSGLQGGKIAMVSKTHHCMADGVGGAETMMELFDFEANPRKKRQKKASKDKGKARPPTRLALFQEALKGRRNRTGSIELINKSLKSMLNKRTALKESTQTDLLPPGMTSIPKLRFNGQISRFRSVAFGSLPMADVKLIKNVFGVTLNDAVLAACSIALRNYLNAHGDTPQPIVCTVPVSLALKKGKDAKKDSDGANQVGMMDVKLPIEIKDPVKLIKEVHACTGEAKRVFEQSFEDLINTTVSALPPQIAARGLQFLSGRFVARFPISNVAISNVPGSPIPLYIKGAKVIGNYPMGPVPNGVGLNITMMSYVDRLDYCVQSCRDKIPDPWKLAGFIDAAVSELKAATAKTGPRKKRTVTKKAKNKAKKAVAKKTVAKVKKTKPAAKKPVKKSTAKAKAKTKTIAKKTIAKRVKRKR